MEGGISFEVEVPVLASVYYEKDKGLRNFKHDISVENPTIEANCDAGAMLRFEPTLVVLGCLNVMDAEVDVGATAHANATIRSNSQICADISVAFPVITFSICGDEDADTIMGNMGLSAKWEIISSDDEPFQFGLHYELLPDMTAQFVEKCTYKEQEDTILGNTYITEYGDTKFAFDYSDNWVIITPESEDVFKENVVLKNERDVTITYWEFNIFPLGGNGHASMTDAEVAKVTDSSIENFMIGKIQIVGATDMLTGEEYSMEDGSIFYAVLPQDYIGTHNSMVGIGGIYEEFSFPYTTLQLFG